jgi:hypothetical protein
MESEDNRRIYARICARTYTYVKMGLVRYITYFAVRSILLHPAAANGMSQNRIAEGTWGMCNWFVAADSCA